MMMMTNKRLLLLLLLTVKMILLKHTINKNNSTNSCTSKHLFIIPFYASCFIIWMCIPISSHQFIQQRCGSWRHVGVFLGREELCIDSCQGSDNCAPLPLHVKLAYTSILPALLKQLQCSCLLAYFTVRQLVVSNWDLRSSIHFRLDFISFFSSYTPWAHPILTHTLPITPCLHP